MKISSLGSAIRYVWQAKKFWSRPKRAAILIYDRNGSEVFAPYVDAACVEVFDTRGESINVRVLVATVFRHGLKASLARYADRYIDFVKPAVALTHIDNTLTFYLLKRQRPQLVVISVQNGARDNTLFDVLEAARTQHGYSFSADHILCFGPMVARRYADLIDARVEPIGSFMNNLVPRECVERDASSVLFLSQYRPPHTDWREAVMPVGDRFVPLSEFYSAERFLLPVLARYCARRGLRLQICGCSLNDSKKEHAFFRAILGEFTWEFVPRTDLAGSYRRLDQTHCAVFVDSTLGYEALARGVKAAAFPLRGPALHTNDRGYAFSTEFPERGPFWTSLPEEAEIERVMDYVSTVDDTAWRETYARYVSNVISYDPGNKRFVQLMRQYKVPVSEDNNVQ